MYTAKFPVLFACLQVSNFSFSTSSSSLSLFVFRTVFFRLSHVSGMTGYFQIITFIRQVLPACPVDTSSAICDFLLAWYSQCWWDIQIACCRRDNRYRADLREECFSCVSFVFSLLLISETASLPDPLCFLSLGEVYRYLPRCVVYGF